MRKILTDAFVRAIEAPAAGRLEVTDCRAPGLTLRLTAAGAKSWSFRFRDKTSGRVTRATIGKYPEITLADAREGAAELRRQVAHGTNPVEAKRRARQDFETTTFQHLAERYLAEHSRRKKRSAAADERNLRLHVLPRWGARPFQKIDRADVIALLEGIIEAGKPTLANRVQALVSSVFAFGIDASLLASNPCARLARRGVETAGRRVLADPELRLFWKRIVRAPVSKQLGLALRLQLLTGARPGEVVGMRREELENLEDPARAGWTIPAERMKGKRVHFVPLSELASATIGEALALVPADQPFVFSSPRAKGAIRANAMPIAMQRFAGALGDEIEEAAAWRAAPPTPHDLRRTVATRLAELGIPGEDVSAVLAHSRGGVTKAHYDRYDRAREKRRALDLWADALAALVDGRKRSAAVVPLRAGSKNSG